MKSFKNLNGNERIAYRNIKAIFNYEVGGWYNAYQDGYDEDIPETEKEAKEWIYEESINDRGHAGGIQTGRAPKEMRFAGKQFITDIIAYLFEIDEDVEELKAEGFLK